MYYHANMKYFIGQRSSSWNIGQVSTCIGNTISIMQCHERFSGNQNNMAATCSLIVYPCLWIVLSLVGVGWVFPNSFGKLYNIFYLRGLRKLTLYMLVTYEVGCEKENVWPYTYIEVLVSNEIYYIECK